MHIPDNYLSPQTDAVMAVAMVPVWVHCIKKVRATLDREHMAFLGICAAFSFLLMMFNVPLPGGTTGHAVGGALIAQLLGPEAAAIAVSVALALQALLFGDGGILSFGANCLNMAFVLTFAAAIVFRALNSRLHDKSWGISVSAIVSGWVGLCLAALCAAIEFGTQPMLFTNASGAPLYCPFPLSVSIPAMLKPEVLYPYCTSISVQFLFPSLSRSMLFSSCYRKQKCIFIITVKILHSSLPAHNVLVL